MSSWAREGWGDFNSPALFSVLKICVLGAIVPAMYQRTLAAEGVHSGLYRWPPWLYG